MTDTLTLPSFERQITLMSLIHLGFRVMCMYDDSSVLMQRTRNNNNLQAEINPDGSIVGFKNFRSFLRWINYSK